MCVEGGRLSTFFRSWGHPVFLPGPEVDAPFGNGVPMRLEGRVCHILLARPWPSCGPLIIYTTGRSLSPEPQPSSLAPVWTFRSCS